MKYERAITAGFLACGLSAFAAATVGAQNNQVLPLEKTPQATLTGCFLRETVGNHERYVLTNPIVGSVASVPDGTCTASGQMVKLERINKRTLDVINVGTYVEFTGKLEKAHNAGEADNPCACRRKHVHDSDSDKHLRELEVDDAREVPVVPPRVAVIVAPAPSPAPAPEPEPYVPSATAPPAAAPVPEAPAPTGTTGVKAARKHRQLPHTASQLPLTGLMALLTLTGGLGLRLRRRQSV